MGMQPLSSLQVSDHTAIVEFVLRNRASIGDSRGNMSPVDILSKAKTLAGGNQAMADMLDKAVVDIQAIDAAIPQISAADWQVAVPLVTELILAKDVSDLNTILRRAASNTNLPEALKIGIQVATDILADGATTIYDPKVTVSAIVVDPRHAWGLVSSLFGKAQNLVGDLAKADAVGAIAGALGGAASNAGGGPAAAGSGAAKGAVAGAVAGSTKSAIE